MRNEPQTASRPIILYIDDDRFLLTLGADLLDLHGFRTVIAPDGPFGIETAKTVRPDVILLDLVMPGMDGFEVCRRLRAIPDLRDTPVILFTARQELKVDVAALEAGATVTLRKGYDSTELISTIQRLLGPGLGQGRNT
jgi:two-component system phosphate regulon response regulator PhoB/two-component system alkaline phosphatase synthesis response regulator PhoP